MTIFANAKRALIIVDVQNDFLPGGALGVANGDRIIPRIIDIMHEYDVIAITEDTHPANHISFASNHEGKKPFDVIGVDYGNQTLWPDHCVECTHGQKTHVDILTALNRGEIRRKSIIRVRKGLDPDYDSYSGFFDAGGNIPETDLFMELMYLGVQHVDVVGLATDFCVKATAIDSANHGFVTRVLLDYCAGVGIGNSVESAIEEMAMNMVEPIGGRSDTKTSILQGIHHLFQDETYYDTPPGHNVPVVGYHEPYYKKQMEHLHNAIDHLKDMPTTFDITRSAYGKGARMALEMIKLVDNAVNPSVVALVESFVDKFTRK